MNYFKYTSGESFTLNERDYHGFFHITDTGEAYTEKTFSNSSKLLSPKLSFFSDIYKNKIELNTAYLNNEQPIDYISNVFDNLNKEGLIGLTNIVNKNNLIAFKNIVIDNPVVYDFNPRKNHFYGVPFLPNMEPYALSTINTNIPTDNFNNYQHLKFLNSGVAGSMHVDKEHNFKYILSTGTSIYSSTGNFTDQSPLQINTLMELTSDNLEKFDYNYYISHDISKNKIFLVNLGAIYIYDSSNINSCNNFTLIDKIKLPYDVSVEKYKWSTTRKKYSNNKLKWNTKFHINDGNNPQYIKIGKNLRTSIYDNILYLHNKYSSDLIYQISLTQYNITTVLDIDIRETDDNILILHKTKDDYYVLYIDISDITNTIDSKIESVIPGLSWYSIKFSEIDSDIFYIRNELEYQTRHISYMLYPTGRLEFGNLLYRDNYIWSEVEEYYNDIDITWNCGLFGESKYSNILAFEKVTNGNMYLLLHNNSRLYAMYQPLENRYYNNVDKNLSKSFNDINCSESSIGLYFNNIMSNIIKDTLNLYNNSYGKYEISEFFPTGIPIPDISYPTNNLYINGNETFNILVLRRILSLIKETQTKLVSTSIMQPLN